MHQHPDGTDVGYPLLDYSRDSLAGCCHLLAEEDYAFNEGEEGLQGGHEYIQSSSGDH